MCFFKNELLNCKQLYGQSPNICNKLLLWLPNRGVNEAKDAYEEGNNDTNGEPVGIAILCADPVVPEDVPGDSPKCHAGDPSTKGDEKGANRE